MNTLAFLLLLCPQETPAAENPVKAWEWMVGTWTGEGDWPGTGKYTDRFAWGWLPGGKILKGEYEVKQEGKVVWTATILNAWDSEKKALVSHIYSQDGSIGYGTCVDASKKDTWVIETRSVGAAGVQLTRTTITRPDADTMVSAIEGKKDEAWTAMGSMTHRRVKANATARGAVEAWYAAATAGDKAAALALGTAEWRENEQKWDRSFTAAVFGKGWKVKSYEITSETVEGDSAAISVRAVFINAEGKDDREGMRFKLVRKDGLWWITELG